MNWDKLTMSYLKQITTAAIAKLAPSEAQVLRMRFGIDGFSVYSIREIAAHMGLTESEVEEIEINALRKLRHIKSLSSDPV